MSINTEVGDKEGLDELTTQHLSGKPAVAAGANQVTMNHLVQHLPNYYVFIGLIPIISSPVVQFNIMTWSPSNNTLLLYCRRASNTLKITIFFFLGRKTPPAVHDFI